MSPFDKVGVYGASGRFPDLLSKTKDLADVFEVVKEAVRVKLGVSRAGLMLGLAELGGDGSSFIGGMYPVASNIIIVNKGPLERVRASSPEMYKAYVFHILLHEYVHSVGYVDEGQARRTTLEISSGLFGKDHLVTRLAEDIREFLPMFTYPIPRPMPEDLQLELVKNFDRSNVNYIL
ncbi:MAG: hypothetical protein LUO84_00840 [Methanomassiliicoccales archaeon]|nr:hypothetical protein [Methanomassiliicoccales archaeon]